MCWGEGGHYKIYNLSFCESNKSSLTGAHLTKTKDIHQQGCKKPKTLEIFKPVTAVLGHNGREGLTWALCVTASACWALRSDRTSVGSFSQGSWTPGPPVEEEKLISVSAGDVFICKDGAEKQDTDSRSLDACWVFWGALDGLVQTSSERFHQICNL